MPCSSVYSNCRACGPQSPSAKRLVISCASSMLLRLAFSLLSFSFAALYMSTSAACLHAALYIASAALGDCGCSRAYFSYISASFSGHLISPFHETHTLLSIRLYAARSAHFVCGNFLMTSFMNRSEERRV